jgi:hypothetical protein
MSTRESILVALFAALSTISGPKVLRNESLPTRIPAGGILILRDGDPGEPEVTLSPLAYHYEHRAEIEVLMQVKTAQDTAFDNLCVAIGARITANRTLGGLCDWIEGAAPVPVELTLEGGEPMKAAIVSVMLIYKTAQPL